MKIFFYRVAIFTLTIVLFWLGQTQTGYAKNKILAHRPKNQIVKVKLSIAENPSIFSADGKFAVETDQKTLKTFAKNEQVKISYLNGEYILNYGQNFQAEIRSTDSLKVTPLKMRNLVTAVNFQNTSSWEITDNEFYHSVRFIFSNLENNVILVNEVGIERYMDGLCESGNVDKTAYLKTLQVAARTYALYHSLSCTKYPNEPYCLDSTAGSQIYCGASYTKRSPQVQAARQATKRQVITYNHQVVITPYFSHSDGRTRAWSEVWNGDYPYLQSVPDPCCTTMTLWGHGVGMSGEGARYFADLGWGYKKILKYYYTGIAIEDLQNLNTTPIK
ncbi:MAG: hypothetical protein A2233_01285 [Candidatus Kerfeldbacteria bacterium RIFOXYA2_FULL_38_24]|uniref:Sporulation stage II protein D amidase enhancer LytB N-terminal domain-containing protein n=1 Tax=Candidatus Kerfeldbacteria bacterium RIFOXYB2_FULL_38_14 TaxID=1798547 RepID=A0A1G2BDS5_9BACT|nr:MAG: hypothetical protein A2233_01285 [Candidatus Kerfeldbacteria bacterium RIFOXYA2_FULL_38_24]OGY87368.1 MAG: hypothetical protein A2319_05375 [Candidatus Kerfeldbacteria bacterium RIFOXYB2_FULL_38_14]OGY88850.1 MAG: hypothetical protein A2458_04320 [Candidatus Kerfeldbacteria bacterium RIFOXYC2_FULL_38_9]